VSKAVKWSPIKVSSILLTTAGACNSSTFKTAQSPWEVTEQSRSSANAASSNTQTLDFSDLSLERGQRGRGNVLLKARRLRCKNNHQEQPNTTDQKLHSYEWVVEESEEKNEEKSRVKTNKPLRVSTLPCVLGN